MPPDLWKVHRIAFFGRNVYILYVAEMAQNFRFLLFLWSFARLKFAGIADVIYNGAVKLTDFFIMAKNKHILGV